MTPLASPADTPRLTTFIANPRGGASISPRDSKQLPMADVAADHLAVGLPNIRKPTQSCMLSIRVL